MYLRFTLIVSILLCCGATAEKPSFQKFLQNFCYDCHDEDVQKGEVRLDNLQELALKDKLELLNRVQEQIYIQEMPPKKKKQPGLEQKSQIIDWLSSELKKLNSNKLTEKLKKPEFGNYLDHNKLFSGEYKHLKGFTHDRHWLINEFIFNEKINEIIGPKFALARVEGRKYKMKGTKPGVPVTNPFLLPAKSGVRYYANENLHGGHLLTMISNARILADHLIEKSNKGGDFLPAIKTIMSMEQSHLTELNKREGFLVKYIDRLCQQIYGSKHQSLLPEYIPLSLPKTQKSEGKIKRALGGIDRSESIIISESLKTHFNADISQEEIIQLCYKEWFYAGHDSRKIITRIVFMKNYWNRVISGKKQAKKASIANLNLDASKLNTYKQAILRHRQEGDNYRQVIEKCMTEWEEEFKQQRLEAGPPKKEILKQLINELFVLLYRRTPNENELLKYNSLTCKYVQDLGTLPAIKKLIQTLALRTEFVYRNEYGSGTADEYSRKMLSPRDASYALSYALTDSSPDEELVKAANEGKLKSREDYEREIKRLLEKRNLYTVVDLALLRRRKHHDNLTKLPIRKFRFFREFFGYAKMMQIFKDDKRFGNAYSRVRVNLVEECDLWVENILEKDKNVFEELLTSEDFFVFHSGNNESMQKHADRYKTIFNYFKKYDWQSIKKSTDLLAHADFFKKMKMEKFTPALLKKDKRNSAVRSFNTMMKSITARLGNGKKTAYPHGDLGGLKGPTSRAKLGLNPHTALFFNIDLNNWDYPTQQPAKMSNRKGILTHPAWLISHAQNTETDPVHRGKWIREKLLAGTVPDVPVTVDAVVPGDPHKTLRQRYDEKVKTEYCWNCHEKMNPLGYAFEMFDDFGRYRTQESLEYPENLIKTYDLKNGKGLTKDMRDIFKTLPIDTSGSLDGTGDPKLDGDVKNALELIDKLAQSTKVRQSIIRHAFRFFMGRNEQLYDSKTLIDADQAYLKSGGSFDAVIVSLLTSDSFIYRKSVKK